MQASKGQERFTQYIPSTAPTVTFTGDGRLLFSRRAMERIGRRAEGVEVFLNRETGLLAFVPSENWSPLQVALSARGKERKTIGAYAKRLSAKGFVHKLAPSYTWETLNGKKYLLEKTILSLRRNGQATVAFVINLTTPL